MTRALVARRGGALAPRLPAGAKRPPAGHARGQGDGSTPARTRGLPARRADQAPAARLAAKPSTGALQIQRALARSTEHGSLAAARGYARDDLEAIASVGYHYLLSGGNELARVLFEGLAAVEPSDPYPRLALGLLAGRLGDKRAARAHYRAASRLAPDDPRPLVNLAELAVESGRRDAALTLLERAREMPALDEDARLAAKVHALIGHLEAP